MKKFKLPDDHWLSGKSIGEKTRRMILQGYDIKQMVSFLDITEAFAREISEKHDLRIRSRKPDTGGRVILMKQFDL